MNEEVENENGTVTISIEYFDYLRDKLKKELEKFNEEKIKLEKGMVKVTVRQYNGYGMYAREHLYESLDDSLKKVKETFDKKAKELEDDYIYKLKRNEKRFLEMNVFQFMVWKFRNRKIK